MKLHCWNYHPSGDISDADDCYLSLLGEALGMTSHYIPLGDALGDALGVERLLSSAGGINTTAAVNSIMQSATTR
jgi:hypothetical protein